MTPRQWLGISPANWCIFSDAPRSRVKQRSALRIETVINKPADIGVLARLEHLPDSSAKPARSTTVCL